MFKYNNKCLIICFLLCGLFSELKANDCNINISGHIHDESTGELLDHVHIYIEELALGAVSEDDGNFIFEDLCAGEYHLIFSHIGCNPKYVYLNLVQDTFVHVLLDHHASELEGVVIKDKSGKEETSNSQTIGSAQILDEANSNLAAITETISGVSSIRNGSGIGKPVIHGLYGNRIAILNNGVRQSGQQWGIDHSPEIDPLSANEIKVIKGAASLAHPGSGLGGVVISSPGKIVREPHLHGNVVMLGESNGRGGGLHIQANQYAGKVGWKITGTIKKAGDLRSPNYFLNNTGHEAYNFTGQLEHSVSEKLKLNFYGSTYNTTIGILRGSHIGNRSDLIAALGSDVPNFTEPDFSYAIDAPKQKVQHHLLKVSSKYFISDDSWLEAYSAFQLNDRKEFDIRRSGRTEIPALDLNQQTWSNSISFQTATKNDLKIKTGLDSEVIFNRNDSETGILPIIPDYNAFEQAAFIHGTKRFGIVLSEFGIRYGNVIQRVKAIEDGSPPLIKPYANNFNRFTFIGGLSTSINDLFNINFNTGYANRNPNVNELYSNGLHQGVSGIEEGDVDLQNESALKTTLSFSGRKKDRFSYELLGYFQAFSDYIYLNPTGEIRPTIRGSFPVFKYEQEDADIFGLDFTAFYAINPSLIINSNVAFVRGRLLDSDVPVINLPSDNLRHSVSYRFGEALNFNKVHFENMEIGLTHRYVFRQGRILEWQDFVIAPDAYQLYSLEFSGDLQLRKNRMRIKFGVDNLLDTVYRDYLNRQRYFADDLGRNFNLVVTYKF